MTDSERKMLALVGYEPRRCNDLGTELWGTKERFGGGSAPYARPAYKVLKSLERRGFVASWSTSSSASTHGATG